ncbi:hypothetical protein RND81_04G131700 [Saponaria officinalis]|uniref:Bifunctional inhibitor/plant lipid transfer protein/seed storage helical domain-containing protein n=1 Tax=Saponaria officinalis TaxID=3572 RepID=A0AAW1LLK4_SAPOF
MASSSAMKLVSAVMLCIVVITAPYAAEALTCGQVSSNFASCLAYLKGGPGPSGPCCGGVKRLKGLAQTPQDVQTACGCLKQVAGRCHPWTQLWPCCWSPWQVWCQYPLPY